MVVVGQTPPPWHGQAVMIQQALDGEYEHLALHHARMSFAKSISEVGKFRISKVGKLVVLVARILDLRRRTNAAVLYYPPAGAGTGAILRDAVVLRCTRWAFARTVFHFHASGLSESLRNWPAPARRFVISALNAPDATIRLTPNAPDEGLILAARRTFVVPNGVPDMREGCRQTDQPPKPRVLYVGMIIPSKGVTRILRISAALNALDVAHEFRIVGEAEDRDYRRQLDDMALDLGVQTSVRFLGRLTGADKWQEFASARAFCFPSTYASETQPVAILEALSFGIPVVASSWRGIPDVVEDGVNGFVHPADDTESFAHSLYNILGVPGVHQQLSAAARQAYEEKYSTTAFRTALEAVLTGVVSDSP